MNVRLEGYVESIFEFAEAYFLDDGALFLFHCNNSSLCKEVTDKAYQYNMKVFEDWWGINNLLLASPKDPSHIVLVFLTPNFYLLSLNVIIIFMFCITNSVRLIVVCLFLDSAVCLFCRQLENLVAILISR